MERRVDLHQWASKIEMQRLLTGRPDLKIEERAQVADDEPALRVKSFAAKACSFLQWLTT